MKSNIDAIIIQKKIGKSFKNIFYNQTTEKRLEKCLKNSRIANQKPL